MEELTLLNVDVGFQPGVIQFDAYEQMKAQAISVAEYLSTVEVSEDSLKSAKQTLADARKVVRQIDDARKTIKKQIMGNYMEFEAQIKEITAIIDEADANLSAKTKVLEEQEREAKMAVIKEIWDKRIWAYTIHDMLPNAFDQWLKPQHLNKSVSIRQVETDMVEWLEDTDKAIETLSTMDDEYLVEYLGCLDLTEAIRSVNQRNAVKKVVAATKEVPVASFIISGAANIKLVEMLLKENEIDYTKK